MYCCPRKESTRHIGLDADQISVNLSSQGGAELIKYWRSARKEKKRKEKDIVPIEL